ncbi:biotin--[acetyl-CoA-carboxylase] ligase [Sediminibacillus dalangtanensis]|uniref:Bifunctional ligase/repressor BirA n=1 Tax=Sediminibacillus dalangtanensis TaxID=2729421 RepID=A0ABX7VRS9_9BACI|nr:biotin--[acetyl-CoA-carboxylase] ligase [Sediminibacillus dalangtanensis]QTM99634.1 biotin--[acetyl-CoA-carboxylase] ligase [Sediminibacillus dalangtanensis]
MNTTRNQLIELLKRSNQSFISGQELSENLGISRTAVWKHMKELEKEGYQVQAVPRKGYRISGQPDKLSASTVKWGLRTRWAGKQLFHYPVVESTQVIGHQLAQKGTEEGTVILADEQTAGKGRMGRRWHSAKTEGIWMSIILRPPILPHKAPQITLLTAVAIAEAIESLTNTTPAIKWPNDIFFHDRKAAGILTEMQAEQDEIQYIVLGIGINVNQSLSDLPEDIQQTATSIKQETGIEWELAPLVQQILADFETYYGNYLLNGFAAIKEKWEHYGYKIGEQVHVSASKQEYQAEILGIAEDGALRVRKLDGGDENLYSAEIHW